MTRIGRRADNRVAPERGGMVSGLEGVARGEQGADRQPVREALRAAGLLPPRSCNKSF